MSPQAQGVRVATSEPPAGARLVGPITASDGTDCDILSEKGTEARATVALQEAAARRGIGFVKLTKVKKPYSDHDCFHKAYTLEGLGYAVASAEPRAATTAALPASPPPPALVTSAPPLSAASSAPAPGEAPAAQTTACIPSCATGYACRSGVCEAECEPPCSAQQFCRFDRVCAPRTP